MSASATGGESAPHGPAAPAAGECLTGALPTRRLILKATLTLPIFSVFGCMERAVQPAPPPQPVYFTAAERDFIDAATARLIPDGEDGLGARAAAVTVFIDRQLAGPYGEAAAWYMEGPFANGTAEQGYQLALTPAQLYRAAIGDI
jgi:gluconate 2-dehydrogenase gamma chain